MCYVHIHPSATLAVVRGSAVAVRDLGEVVSLDEMSGHISGCWSIHSRGNVLPRHPRLHGTIVCLCMGQEKRRIDKQKHLAGQPTMRVKNYVRMTNKRI